jgi:hypothetical protein
VRQSAQLRCGFELVVCVEVGFVHPQGIQDAAFLLVRKEN